MQSARETTRLRAVERDAWLQRAMASIAASERYAAAWLIGSLGRGDADELSDVDLVTVLYDAEFDRLRLNLRPEVERFGSVVSFREVPHNGPPGGTSTSVSFAGRDGSISIDWYWQPLSAAVVPSDARVVSNKADVPRADPPMTFDRLQAGADRPSFSPPKDPVESTSMNIEYFWGMLAIASKYAARRESTLTIVPLLKSCIGHVRSFVGEPASSAEVEGSEIEVLIALADQMLSLHSTATDGGARLPDDLEELGQYVRLMDRLLKEDWERR